jgi:hypothetical protein
VKFSAQGNGVEGGHGRWVARPDGRVDRLP